MERETLYFIEDVNGTESHPLFIPGRKYRNRPNVGAVRKGAGKGPSLLLSGHVDPLPKGSAHWTKNPVGAEIEGNRLFGRGANDMKAAVGTNLFIIEALTQLDARLAGDLLFGSVVDEEFGGVNGTLAGRLMGFNADAAILSEPSSLRICPAQRRGRTVHITLSAPGGALTENTLPAGIIEQLTFLLTRLPHFAARRKARSKPHQYYFGHPDPVPVTVTKVGTAPLGNARTAHSS
jgi:acetylornithine deacetylase